MDYYYILSKYIIINYNVIIMYLIVIIEVINHSYRWAILLYGQNVHYCVVSQNTWCDVVYQMMGSVINT